MHRSAGVWVLCLSIVGCGSSSESSEAAADAGSDAVVIADTRSPDTPAPADASGAVHPPGAPTGAPATPSNDVTVFALRQIFLGDTTRAGVVSTTAWKSFGYDLDGKISTKDSSDVCTSPAGASSASRADGDNGIDNSFGANLLPIIQPTSQASSTHESEAFAAGDDTYVLSVRGLTSDPLETHLGLGGAWFRGASFGGTPTFTTADDWPVTSGSLVDGTLAGGAKTSFPGSYVVSGTWVSGGEPDVTLTINAGGSDLSFVIHHAVVTFEHSAPGKATQGTLAGVLTTSEVVESIRQMAGRVSTALCSGSTFDSIATQIRGASDILRDGTNVAGMPCDGISIGIGFEAEQIGPITRVSVDPPAPPNPCP